MPAAFPTLVVSRRPRTIGPGWASARSWLGGAPRIGDSPWPRSRKGTPMHFMAQVDLAELAAASGDRRLPASGSLAFFVGHNDFGGQVVFTPAGSAASPASPPAGTPDLSEWGGAEEWATDLSGRPLYPYWPIDFTKLDIAPPEDEADYEAYDEYLATQTAAVEKRFGRREYGLSPRQAYAGPPVPDWWQIAFHYVTYLDKAVSEAPGVLEGARKMLDYTEGKLAEARAQADPEIAKAEAAVRMYEGKIAKLLQLAPALHAFVAEVAAYSQGRDPWELMSADELSGLAALWARNAEFDIFHFNSGKFPIAYLREEMFRALPATGTDAFNALPFRVRELLNEKRAPRPQWWFMAVHYAKRLRHAAKAGVAGAAKYRQDNIAAYRKRLDQLQPKARGMFGRKREPKGKDELAVEAEIARMETELARLRELLPAFIGFVQETSAWADGRDPWAPMATADVDDLKARIKRAQEEFGEFARYYTPRSHEDLEGMTLVVLASAEDRGYATLPPVVREMINRDCLLAPGGWHQMFGQGVEIQGDSGAMRGDGYIMLLQLVHDDLMQWRFGDNGAYQFWISPADLASRNWAGVRLTFESH